MQHLLHQLGCMVFLQVNTLEQTWPRSPCTVSSRGRMCDVSDLPQTVQLVHLTLAPTDVGDSHRQVMCHAIR